MHNSSSSVFCISISTVKICVLHHKISAALIIEALDLVRKFRKVPTPKVYANVVGIDTVIKFHWDVKEFGFIECTLSEDYLKLFVMDDNSNILVNDVEIDNVEYNSIDFIIEYFWRVVSGEIKIFGKKG